MTRVRNQVLLDPDQELKLRALAERWHSSESEVLRIGLDRLMEEEMVLLSSQNGVDGEEGSRALSELVILNITSIEIGSAFNRILRERRIDTEHRNRLWRLFLAHRRLQYRVVQFDARIA